MSDSDSEIQFNIKHSQVQQMESCHSSDAESVNRAALSQNQLQYSHNGYTGISDSDDKQNQSTVESESCRSSSPQYVSFSPHLPRPSSEPQRTSVIS